jgi:hypothetical protein
MPHSCFNILSTCLFCTEAHETFHGSQVEEKINIQWHVCSGSCNMYYKEGYCNFSGGSNNISLDFSNFNFAFQKDVIFIVNRLLYQCLDCNLTI